MLMSVEHTGMQSHSLRFYILGHLPESVCQLICQCTLTCVAPTASIAIMEDSPPMWNSGALCKYTSSSL